MRKNKKSVLIIALIVVLCLVMIPFISQAAGTDNSDRAQTIFFYADDENGKLVLVKAISLDTLKAMSHGVDENMTTYYSSFIDNYPTPIYCEGKGITIPELMEYVINNSSVNGADSLTYDGNDRMFFICTDKATINYTSDNLLNVDHYYYPDLYSNWDAEYTAISDVSAVLATGIPMPVYLATESRGGRVFYNAGGNNISSYIADNNNIVDGCLTNYLEDDDALRLVVPQTTSVIQNSTATYGDIKKWVHKLRLKMSDTSPITSLGPVDNPTCTYTLEGTTLTITMDCADEDASIYYSSIGGYTKMPLILYTEPIEIEDYDTSEPFTIGVMAVEEGYEDSQILEFGSANITDSESDPAFSYTLSCSDSSPTIGTAFILDVILSADIDFMLYGAEYRINIPAGFAVDGVTSAGDWQVGTADSGDYKVITFAYLDTIGSSQTGNTDLDVGSITLIPVNAGDYTLTVLSAVVTKANSVAYSGVSADGLDLTVTGSGLMLGDINGDNSITMLDALKASQTAAKVITLTAEQMIAADVNKDGSVTMLDALKIAQYATKVISSF
jgi:hypothetical protein